MKAASEQLKRLEEDDLLKSGITLLDLDNHEYLYSKLLIYIDLLIKWNKTYNLTSLTKKEEIERNKGHLKLKIPQNIDYKNIHGLSIEARHLLEKHLPETVDQASRISGITPATISILLVFLKRKRANESSQRTTKAA